MELWIRSQDKMNLQKAESIYFSSDFNFNDNSHDHNIWVNEYIFGTYKTKERALQVLDEIQNILQPKLQAIVRPSEEMVELLGSIQAGKTMKMKQYFEFKELSTYVYKMPQE